MRIPAARTQNPTAGGAASAQDAAVGGGATTTQAGTTGRAGAEKTRASELQAGQLR